MSRNVLTVGSTMRILLLYREEYSQWVERFMNYLEEQTDGEAMINSIKNGDQPLPRITQVSIAGTILSSIATRLQKTYGMLLRGICLVLNMVNKIGKLQFCMRDVNDAMRSKKKIVVVTSDPLALIAEKTNVSRSKVKVVVSSNSEGSEADDFRGSLNQFGATMSTSSKGVKCIKTEMLSIYSLIDSNKTAKDLWDALARHMLGSEYGEQDRKATVLYEYETFKANEGELLLDTSIRYLQVINDLKKCDYSKDNCELNFKFLNNLQLEWKQYATMMRQNKNLMDINIDALYNILKQNQGDVNDAMGSKKKLLSKEKLVVSSDSEGSEADDFVGKGI
nr:hypothetical protein [Tanacetum cinerariifolium]